MLHKFNYLIKHTKNITKSAINNSNILMYSFASGQKLLHITKQLNKLDSTYLDKLCQQVLEKYNLEENKKRKQKNKQVNKNKMGELKKDIESIEKNKKQGNEAQRQEFIKFLYETGTEAQVGLLKGDIHSQFVFKFNKYLSEKDPKDLQKEVTPQQFKRILNLATQIKSFRLPKKGVKNSNLQDKKNFYQRQLLLQIVSHEQSTQKYEYTLQSLSKLGKIPLTSPFRKNIIQWFPPLCAAIKQEQNKCKDQQNLTGNRKKYARDFVKLAPERLTLVCLSELSRSITQILYRDFVRQGMVDEFEEQKQPQFQQYQSIKYRPLCISLAKWVSIQSHFEQIQREFKKVMKLYDTQNKARVQQQNLLQAQKKQRQIKQMSEANEKIVNKNQPQQTSTQQIQTQQQTKQQTNSQSIEQRQQKLKKRYEQRMRQIQQTYNQKYISTEERKTYLQMVGNKLLKDYYKTKSEMSQETQYQIGAVLIYLMKQILRTQNSSGYKVPLLTLEHKFFKNHGEIISDKRLKINDHFLNTILPAIQKQGDLFMHLQRSIPTIIPPLPWVQYEIGGYYLYPSTFMKTSQCKQQERLIKYADLSRVYNVLNQLSKIPWKINKKVLNVMQSLWQEGGNVGQMPKRYSQMITPYLIKLQLQQNYQKKKQILKDIQKFKDQHSLRCDFNLKLNLARSYSKLDRFYFPHNVDFRGRVYPIPPHLNHIGNDLSRGLLMFADGKQLGQSGLRWLKIHVANLMGKDKATIPQKLQFIEANLSLIHAITENPLKNKQWLHNQDCWQSLGAIFELAEALKLKQPEQYVSCLHIHQDGSCNGLQHYAALGRDTEGAYQVNLGPTQRPGDVYTHVAKMVIRKIDQQIADITSKNHDMAKKLAGNIKRKTIKQTVMTSVYGVTFLGARQQIYRQIKDQNFLKDEDEQYDASIYLAKLTLDAISNLFSSAHLIKKWLIQCAGVVSNQGNPMGWITPMGLPVVQPYRKQSNIDVVNTVVHSLKLARSSSNLPVNKSKQKSAFPPNYIHSLDSTHMMYTAEKCLKQGIVFAAVHDSYWTHAATVEKMNKILRQQFIRLHSQPLLQNLKRSLQMRYPCLQFPEIPKRGDFNLQKIKESIYFFS